MSYKISFCGKVNVCLAKSIHDLRGFIPKYTAAIISVFFSASS